jgi:hypothetical protein
MANLSLDDDEKPLDPTLVRVQARLRRLMLISLSTLAIGIFAVFAAILYRIVSADSSAPANGAVVRVPAAALDLPADAHLVATALDGNRMAYTYETGGSVLTLIVDGRTGAVVGRVELGGVALPAGQ